jgi:hypothetical protein
MAEVDLRMELPADRDIAMVQLRGRRGRGEGRDGQRRTIWCPGLAIFMLRDLGS